MIATAPIRERLLAREDIRTATTLVRAAVRETHVEMRSGGLSRETGVTGSLVTELNQQFRNATAVRGTFRAREMALSEEAKLGGDILLLLVTPNGDKWTQLQGKLGRRMSSEWGSLQSECARMRQHGSSRALVYYEDEFIAADARKVPTPASRPVGRQSVRGDTPRHWYPLHTSLSFFFDCWGGSRRHIPAAIDPGWLLGITYASRDRPEALDDLIGRVNRTFDLLVARSEARDVEGRPQRGNYDGTQA